MPGKLTLRPTWNYDPLPASDQTSLTYLLVDVVDEEPAPGATPAPSEGTSLNISLVLDTSGSMAGAKLQNLKSAVGRVIDHLSPHDMLAITLFDDEVHPLTPSTPVTDRQALKEQVNAIREAGGTAMSKGLLVGLDEAMKGRRPGDVSRIVLLTDGQTWGDADRCKELSSQAGAAGIPVTALGVGAEEDWSIELLDTIANESGGLSDYIAKPEEIARAFERTIVAMHATGARNLRLTFNPAGGVGVRNLYRVAPIIANLWPGAAGSAQPQTDGSATALSIPLGDLPAGGTQTLLLEILLPPRKPGQYRLARLLLNYEASGEAAAERDEALDLVMTFAPGAAKGPGNPRVMNSVEKATTFRLQTRALQASMAGDVAGAAHSLRAAATRLLNMGETELAEASEREAQLLETNGKMSSAGTKKLSYETRRLSVPEAENANSGTQ